MEYIRKDEALKAIVSVYGDVDVAGHPLSAAYERVNSVPHADVVERLLVESKINWLRSRCREGVERYFDREQWDHLGIIDVRDSIAKRNVAEWIDAKFNYLYKCSGCNYYTDIRSKYCPDCGARMMSDGSLV